MKPEPDWLLYASTDRHEEWGGPKRYIRVEIYRTVEHYLEACNTVEHEVASFSPPQKWDKESERIVTYETKNYGGKMRFSLPFLSYEVIAHESTHAAAAIYRMDVSPAVNLGKTIRTKFNNEEKFSYLLGNITGSVLREIFLADLKVLI